VRTHAGLRRLRRLLTADREPGSVEAVWRRQPHELARALIVVRVFYACAAFMMLNDAQSWPMWAKVKAIEPLWPIAWAEHTDAQTAIPIVLGAALASTVCALLVPELRVVRLAAAVGLLMQSALVNSLAGAVVSHGLHAWLWTAAFFVFLPSGSAAEIAASHARSQRYLRVFWGAQALLLFCYSLSGSIKLAGAVLQAMRGEVHAFMPEALARHTAARILEGADVPAYFAAGPWLIDHPSFGALAFPLSIYLEAFAFLIAFRPALHRIWASGLILMHLGIYFVMTILFSQQILILALLLVASPFGPPSFTPRAALAQLPLLGDLRSWVERRRARVPATARAAASSSTCSTSRP
jgi:hypothetical protein